jgi:glycosyltransferase involved in cell wall biosynthesis
MRIAYVSADVGVPVFGAKGASVHVRELARALHSLGHELLIVTARAGGSAPADFHVPVRELSSRAGAGLGATGIERRALQANDALRRYGRTILREFRPDAVYERYSLFGTAGAELAAQLDVPFLLEVNAPLVDEQAMHRGLDWPTAARRLERRLLRSSDHVIAVSQRLRQWLVELGLDERRVTVIPNGVDVQRFRPPARKAAGTLEEQLGLDGRPLVGFLGTLKPWHDVATLIRAVALLQGGPSPPRLLVLGDGPERARLGEIARREGLRSSTIFTGSIPYERVPAYLAALDVAVAPYGPGDGFYFSPLKLFEYLAAARPVVAAAVGDIGHCIRPGATGCLYPPGDVAALAGSIRALLEDRERAAALGRAGREHVCAQHTWQANARVVVELVWGELEARRSRRCAS